MNPRISIVMPSFNQARFLEEALESVLGQVAAGDEVFVYDGGSTDGSKEIIEAHRGRISYWRSRTDSGQASVIAEGFERATGEILAWLNSDDVLLPGALEAVRRSFVQDSSREVVTGWDVVIDARSTITAVRRPGAQTLAAALWGVTHVSQPTCFFQKAVYMKAGGINCSLGGVLDTELWYRMLRVAPSWGLIPRVLAAYRVHPAAKGSSWLEGYAREHALLAQMYPEFNGNRAKHAVGLWVYRAKEALRGRYLRDRWLTEKYRGLRLAEAVSAGLNSSEISQGRC